MAPESWGPATFEGTANVDGHPIVPLVRPFLPGMDLAEVTVRAEWPDGNSLEKPVQVTLSMPYRPAVTFIFGNPTYTLRASSNMRILH